MAIANPHIRVVPTGGFTLVGVVRGDEPFELYFDDKDIPQVRCGCYQGSLDNFAAEIERIPTDTNYVHQLRLLVQLARMRQPEQK